MSLFRTHSSPVAAPQFTGLQIQTSSSALPIPILYGITRLAPNLIWSGAFQTVPQYAQSGGGKGGGRQGGVTGYTYTTALVFALCEGPIQALGTVYKDQGLHNASEFFFSLATGTTPQATWGYLDASFPAQSLAYGGTAYAASASFDLGSSASIDTVAFEVYGRLYGSGVVNAHDADPALVIADFLTNAQYGAGFPAASLDATSLLGGSGGASYQCYCQAMGLAFSPCLTDSEAANSVLARWLTLTNATAVWSGGRLKIVPYGDAPATGTLQGGASVTFVPNLVPVASLTDDDFVAEANADPVTVTRDDPYSAPNLQRLEILDRGNQYSATPIEARDQNAIEIAGLIAASTVTAHEICDTAVAAVSAQLILQRGLYVRNGYNFRLSWEWSLLEPMDVVSLTDVGLGLDAAPVRITAIEEDADGLLQVTAEELPGTAATAPLYPVSGATNTPINRAVAPAPVNPPIIFEPPADLTGGAPQVWVALSGGTNGSADPNWGGATVYVSTDNATYLPVGAVAGPARQGVTTSALAAPAAATPTDTLGVSLAESAATLVLSGAQPLPCFCGGEFLTATAATLTATSCYELGGLAREQHGFSGAAHPAGTPFCVLDGALFKYTLPETAIGCPLFLKFASLNSFGAAAQDLSTCIAYSLTPVGSGLFGPVAQAIAVGTPLDDGQASGAVAETDDFGLASDPYSEHVDMGLASDGAASLAVGAGGTGAVTSAQARANLGAAASGANGDITSLTNLTGLGIGTALDPNNVLAVKGTSSLFDNTGGSVGLSVNKANVAASAYHLFETGYSGRAQVGLLGSDRWRVSVSATGTAFTQAVDVDPATGHVGLAGYTADGNNALGVTGTSCLFTAATDSMRFTFNKVAPANDCTLTFETGFSARAIAGTTGSDGYQLKVSPDGSTFFQVYVVDQTTGNIAFKALIGPASYPVASLPATAFNGAMAFAANGRKLGEAAGAGTGVVVAYSNGAWRRLSDDSVVAS